MTWLIVIFFFQVNQVLTNSVDSLQLIIGSVVGVSALIFLTGCGLGLLIGLIIMKSKQTKPQVPNINSSTQVEVPNINPSTREEEETAPVTGPVYEEIQLKNICGEEIYCSQNVAYDTPAVN